MRCVLGTPEVEANFAFVQKKVKPSANKKEMQEPDSYHNFPYKPCKSCYEESGSSCLKRQCPDGKTWYRSNRGCCIKSCKYTTCSSGRQLKKDADKLVSWNEFACCECIKCSSFSCPADQKLKADAENVCGTDTAACCIPKCSTYACPTGYANKSEADLYGSDTKTCCDGVPCGQTACPAGSTKKDASETVEYDGQSFPCCNSPSLAANTKLGSEASLQVPLGRLTMQGDGNLVLYDAQGRAAWATHSGGGGNYLSFQGDCNLVVYRNDGSPVWARCNDANSNKGCGSDCSGAKLVLQYDLNLVLYRGAEVLWASRK